MTELRPGWHASPAEPDDVLAAMADPTRRQLLATLAATGPATATELAAGLPVSRQAIAKHLAVLRSAASLPGTRTAGTCASRSERKA